MKIEGEGLPVILFLIFLTLKLCGVINWSWWWVTCPLWMGLLIAIVIGLLIVIVKIIQELKS